MIEDILSQLFFYIIDSYIINIDLRIIPTFDNVFFNQSLQIDNYCIYIIYYRYNETGYIVSRYLYTKYRKYNQLGHHISNCPEMATDLNCEFTMK